MLVSMSSKGYFDAGDVCQEMYQHYSGFSGKLSRVSQKFIDHRARGSSWNQCASDDDVQFLCICKVPIIVARYAGSPTLMEKITEAVQIHQTNARVVAAAKLAARLLEQVILGNSILDTLLYFRNSASLSLEEKQYIISLEQTVTAGGSGGLLPFSLAAEQLGLSSELPGCFVASLYGLLCFQGYEVAIRANIVAGGDNVCRSWLLGCLLAAEQGETAIPEAWKKKTTLYKEIFSMAHRLAGSNTYFETFKEKTCKF
jgi:ADP-ribosylglycohydrolase